ncbi:MAG TPA: hypothetical protein VFY84_11880 [Jiangellales bacterium]|nr:hypothetical protein [Jiangellales bacterium]
MTFADFVGESLQTLTRHACALTGERHAAEDLVQDTLVKLSVLRRSWIGRRKSDLFILRRTLETDAFLIEHR